MRTLTKALLAALLLAPTALRADENTDGKRVYMTKTCLACHGRGGAAPVLSYPALAGQSEKYLVEQLEAIRDGERVGTVDPTTGHPYVQGMVDIMHLVTEEDIANVAEWLAAQPAAAPRPVEPAPDAAMLEEGAKLYKKYGCRACHGAEGEKPSTKTYPFIAGMNAEYLARAMTEIRDKERVSGSAKLMWPTIKKASDEDILAIAAWLSTIDRSAN